VEYKRQIVWGQVGEKFFQREKNNAIKMAENKELIRQVMMMMMFT
jgi:type III secretion system FlhB-like substrate exporter